jgi:hypothetical protein
MRAVVRESQMKTPAIFKILVLTFAIVPICLFGQRIIVESFDGKNIVLYTPEYKVLLSDEIKTGASLPARSVIETGPKSTVELRIEPSGSVVKLSENSTLKVIKLSGYDGSSVNELKLIGGVVRAVCIDSESLFTVTGHVIECSTKEADFGLIVKKNAEESVVVLKGDVELSSPGKRSVRIRAGEMANGLGLDTGSQPSSSEYLSAIKSLAFSGMSGIPDTSVLPEAENHLSDVAAPSIEQVGTEDIKHAEKTDSILNKEANGVSDERSKDSGKNDSSKADSERLRSKAKQEKVEPSEYFPEIEDQPGFIPGQLKVNDVGSDMIFALPENGEVGSDWNQGYKLGEIYNVYRKCMKVRDRVVYSDFVDVVFLNEIRVKEKILLFAYTWEGEKKNISKGFYLSATGRFYNPANKDIKPIVGKPVSGDSVSNLPGEGENGKKETTADPGPDNKKGSRADSGDPGVNKDPAISGDPSGTAASGNAQNDKDANSLFGLGFGVAATYPYFTGLGPEQFNIVFLLLNLRSYAFVELYVKPIPLLGIGVETGVAYMRFQMTYMAQDLQLNLLDVPVRGFIRLGTKELFAEIYGGYYFSLLYLFDASGIEIGLRGNVFGLIADCSYVYCPGINLLPGLPLQYLRFSLGYSLKLL